MIPKYSVIQHKAIVDNYRRMAKVPETITDEEIYRAWAIHTIHVSSAMGKDEIQDELEYLREKLGLKNTGVITDVHI